MRMLMCFLAIHRWHNDSSNIVTILTSFSHRFHTYLFQHSEVLQLVIVLHKSTLQFTSFLRPFVVVSGVKHLFGSHGALLSSCMLRCSIPASHLRLQTWGYNNDCSHAWHVEHQLKPLRR